MPHPSFLLLGRPHAGTWLLAVQLAIGVVLGLHAGHAVEALRAARTAPSGIDDDRLLLVPWMTMAAHAKPETEAVLRTLRAVPGVASATASNQAPYGSSAWSVEVEADTVPGPRHLASAYFADDAFLATLGLSPARGRGFLRHEYRADAGDRHRPHMASAPVLVSGALAARLYGDADPLGRTFTLVSGARLHVVGVVERIPQPASAHHSDGAVLVLPMRMARADEAQFIVRHQGDAGTVSERIRAALATAHPSAVVAAPVPLSTLRERSLQAPKRGARVALLACIAWWVFCLGMLVLGGHRWIREHAQEISLRRATGASGAQLARRLRWEYLLLALGACLPGLACAAWALPQLAPGRDAFAPSSWTVLATIACTAAVVQLAAAWPVRLARRIPPHLVSRSPSVRL